MVSYTYTNSRDNAPMARFRDAFNEALDWGASNGERRHAVVASGSAASAKPAAAPLTEVKVGFSPIADYAPLFIGLKLGLFKKQGLDVTGKKYKPIVVKLAEGGK
jgi:hypothetical protein